MAVAGWLIAAVAPVPLTLGLLMEAYALAGKRRFRDWMLARHSWRVDEQVLDVGAGSGLMTIGAARLVPAGRVTAIDIWRMVDLTGKGPDALRAKLDAAGVAGRVVIKTMNASIDVGVSVLGIHNIEPEAARNKALAETARVLKPDGVADIADYTGVKSYARVLRDIGLEVTGPVNAIQGALSLMFLIKARKPTA